MLSKSVGVSALVAAALLMVAASVVHPARASAAGPSDASDASHPSFAAGARANGPNGDASHPSVVGGANAPYDRFPFQVAVGGIGSSSSPGQFCGGTLVETDSIPVVVTAAHCIGSTDTAKNVGVVLGGYGLWTDKKDLGGGTLYKLKSIIVHPNYNKDTNLDDIAVLILKKTPVFSTYVQAIPMATAAETTAAASIPWLISGWGTTSLYADGDGYDGNTPENLQYGKVNYVQPSDPICLNVTTNAPIGSAPAPEAAAKMICGYGIPSFDGGNPPRQDTCQGDSGGPLTLNVGITAGQDPVSDGAVSNDRLAGIVSYGAGCGQNGLPGIYTRASTYIDWVNQQAAANAKKRSTGRKSLL